MIRGKCPTCRKDYGIKSLDELPSFPFCSARCRLVDLGRWADGAYAIPGSEPAPEPLRDPDPDEGEYDSTYP